MMTLRPIEASNPGEQLPTFAPHVGKRQVTARTIPGPDHLQFVRVGFSKLFDPFTEATRDWRDDEGRTGDEEPISDCSHPGAENARDDRGAVTLPELSNSSCRMVTA